jgi:hypothetical protein
LTRRFAREDAIGFEVVRAHDGWIVRAELAYSDSRDPQVGDALPWAISIERATRNGAIVVTVADNAIATPVSPLLLFDRAFLPYFIATTTQVESWGDWRILWLGTYRRVGGVLELELARAMTETVRLTVGADLPHGSRTSSPGAIGRARRVRAGLRWSW